MLARVAILTIDYEKHTTKHDEGLESPNSAFSTNQKIFQEQQYGMFM